MKIKKERNKRENERRRKRENERKGEREKGTRRERENERDLFLHSDAKRFV